MRLDTNSGGSGLDDTVDRFCLGGIVGKRFLRAGGHTVGYDVADTSLFDHQRGNHWGDLERILEAHRNQLHLPPGLAYEADCFSVVDSGDTARAVELYDFDEDDFSRITITGGTYVHALTGDPLVGVDVLEASH